ncbi:MAG: phosphate ABC transporter permease PstA [Chthoniobacterales bacterium]|jgi:phosphate transport system permease protein|nr:phosphate ABC transporter permease PstA [Chthoniobacterales bacterium]
MDNLITRSGDFFGDNSPESTKMLGRSFLDRTLTALCIALSFLALVPLASILYLVVKNGLPLLGWSVFTELPPAAGMTGGGFGNAVIGTLAMVGLALALSAPPAVLAAIYICEYHPKNGLSGAVRFSAKLLTGVPSIICGVFAFAIVVLATGKFSALAGGVALAVLMLPTILLTSEQALLGVQRAYREASYGLGATRFQTIVSVVLPDALPGIMTGIMLSVARAAGETAPLVFTALFSQFWMSSLMEPTASLSVLIYNFSAMPFEHQVKMAWTASLVLVLLVTATNVTAQLVFGKRHA